MKVKDGHKLGILLCMQELALLLLALIEIHAHHRISPATLLFIVILGFAEGYNLYRLRGKELDDEW